MDYLGRFGVGGLAVLLALGGCAESEMASVCGSGEQRIQQGGADVCVAESALVIEGGFECGARASFRYELGDNVLCATRELERSDLDAVCERLDLECRSPAGGGGPPPTLPFDAAVGPGPGEQPVKHASCGTAFPTEPPAPPSVPREDDGRPKFDAWRDIDCAEATATASLCSEWTDSSPDECGSCVKAPGASEGVCATIDIDTSCDGEGEVLSVEPGCYICAPIAARARACCEGLDVDCRAWPYPADGEPGMVCAEHSDCEPGLVCGAPGGGDGYGLCRCPEAPPVEWNATCDFGPPN